MVEIEIDAKDGSYKIRDRRTLEELGRLGADENPYVNMIANPHTSLKLYCPFDQRRLFWDGVKGHYQCLDCNYIPPDPRKEEEEEKELEEMKNLASSPSIAANRIKTRRGKIATGERYTRAIDRETGGVLPVVAPRIGLRGGGHGEQFYRDERPLDTDERAMIEKGYKITSREEQSGDMGTYNAEDARHQLRLRLSKEKARRGTPI